MMELTSASAMTAEAAVAAMTAAAAEQREPP